MLNSNQKKFLNYGSTTDRYAQSDQEDFGSRDSTKLKQKKKFKHDVYKSDSYLNYLPSDCSINNVNFRRDSLKSIIFDTNEEYNKKKDDSSQTSSELILTSETCNCSYIIEPVAFIQNLATSIMAISLGQFIYNRILNRLIKNFNINKLNLVNSKNENFLNLETLNLNSNTSNICQASPFSNITINEYIINFISKSTDEFMTGYSKPPYVQISNSNFSINPDDYEKIRTQAQSETAHLYFVSALFNGIPMIIMTNLLGVNSSRLGRKTLMLIYLTLMSIKFCLILFQSEYPEWPDWLFYLGAFIDGISGSSGIFYLSLYCYIADLTSPSSRSYRITLLNSLNSIASLCVTFLCGYIIKFYGYYYLFLASLLFMITSLVYTIFFIPEPLVELRDKSLFERLKLCSFKQAINCFTVYFSKEKERCKKESEMNESISLIKRQNQRKLSKQTFMLLLIVFANFLYNFGTIGIGSIFTLFIMNSPFCFDSVQISNYSVFSTLISLFMSLLVSKFLKINDILICILSVASYFVSVLCYLYGNSTFYIYLSAVIASISSLQYGYVRSIVTKTVEKSEISDALSLILIVDTIITVSSSVLFPVLYSSIISKGINILFSFSNGFILLALIFHIVNYFIYDPTNQQGINASDQSINGKDLKYKKVRRHEVSLPNSDEDDFIDILIRTNEKMELLQSTDLINNPHHQSIEFDFKN